jgi:uncharacterized protein YqkB
LALTVNSSDKYGLTAEIRYGLDPDFVSHLLITPNTANCSAAEHGVAILKLVAHVSIAYASLDSTLCVITANLDL